MYNNNNTQQLIHNNGKTVLGKKWFDHLVLCFFYKQVYDVK